MGGMGSAFMIKSGDGTSEEDLRCDRVTNLPFYKYKTHYISNDL